MKKTKTKMYHLIVYALAFMWAGITILPLIITILSSFKTNSEIYLGVFNMPREWNMLNYIEANNIANALNSIKNSLFLAIIATILVTCIGMMAAYILSRKKNKVVNKIYVLFLLGVMVPIHCTIIPISSMASAISAKNSYIYLLLIYVTFNLAQAIFLYTGYLDGVDRELDDAAKIDGCNDITLLIRILFPICKPIIVTEAIFVFIWAYGELIFSLTLISDYNKFTVSRALLSFTTEHAINLGPKFAFIIMAMIPTLLIYIFMHEKVQSGVMSGAIKA